MTYTQAPQIFQSLIVLAQSRKDVLTTAMQDARHTFDRTDRREWATAPVETAVEQRARTRAERLAWFVESL